MSLINREYFKLYITSISKKKNKLIGVSSFINQVSKGSDLSWVLSIAALLGILYGIFVNPMWSEPVDFAQVWAGIIEYNKSPLGEAIFDVPSLQIYIPALLLLAHVPVWPLCLGITSFFCAISFSAIAAASFALSRNVIISISLVVVLLFYRFYNSHGYPIAYPIGYFQFGQTGQYFALLAFSLLACGRPRTAGVIGGLLSGIHTVWFVCFLVGSFPVTALTQRKALKPLSISLIITFFISIGVMYYAQSLMPARAHYQYTPPVIPASVLESPINEEDKDKIIPNNEIRQKRAPEKKKVWRGHAVVFSDASSLFQAITSFFLPELIFAFLCIPILFSRGFRFKLLYARRLLCMIIIPILAATIYQLIGQNDPSYSVLGLIHPKLPALAVRAIFNRWFNLTSLLIPIMIFSLLFILYRDKKSGIALMGVCLLYTYLTLRSSFCFIPMNQSYNLLALGAVIFFVVMCFYSTRIKTIGNELTFKRGCLMFTALCTVFFTIRVAQLTHSVFVLHKFKGSDAVDLLVAKAREISGPIIVSSGVVSVDNFNPQLRTQRPIIVPTNLDVYDKYSKTIIHVFCPNNNPTFEDFYAHIQSCFENRPAWQWGIIRQETQATSVITPSAWKLKIKPTISGGGFSYYNLGEVS